jgi:hypothetical protein
MTTPTPPGPLARSNYLSWPPGPYQADADPNNTAFDPANVLPIAGLGNAALDAEQYYRPLEQLHGTGMHGAGVAFGLQVSVAAGQPNVIVMPGLALDPSGRHIYLGAGGSAEIGPSADVPNTPPDLIPVPASGAVLPTAGLAAGTYYVVAQWRETWNSQSSSSNPNTDFYTDTPWLRLVTAAGHQASTQVVLGQVVLEISDGGTPVVQTAGYGDVGGLQRSAVSVPAQALTLRRAVATSTPGADTVAWGAVRARESGGVEIAVAKGSDQVALVNDAGGNFSTLAVGASQATFGSAANPGINLNGAEATIFVGAPGNYGDVLVSDGAGHMAVSLVGDTGHVIVGGPTLNGQVRVKNAGAVDTMTLNGANGAAVVQRVSAFANNTVDVDGFYFHVHAADLALDGRSGQNNRALVDWGDELIINFAGDYHKGVQVDSNLTVECVLMDSGGTPLMASPVRKAMTFNLLSGSSDFSSGHGNVATLTIDLGKTTNFTAFTFFDYIQNYVSFTYHASAVAEIFQIDGAPTAIVGQGGPLGNCFTPVVTNGTGRTIGFRARTAQDSIEIQATIVVFFE